MAGGYPGVDGAVTGRLPDGYVTARVRGGSPLYHDKVDYRPSNQPQAFFWSDPADRKPMRQMLKEFQKKMSPKKLKVNLKL